MERGIIETPPAKEPRPFLPDWEATVGPLVERGSGILSNNIFKTKDLIDRFRIFTPQVIVVILPKLGQIWFGSELVFQGQKDSKLVWFRRMQQTIFSWDKNSAGAECLWYAFGLRAEEMNCFRLYEDGRITKESVA